MFQIYVGFGKKKIVTEYHYSWPKSNIWYISNPNSINKDISRLEGRK